MNKRKSKHYYDFEVHKEMELLYIKHFYSSTSRDYNEIILEAGVKIVEALEDGGENLNATIQEIKNLIKHRRFLNPKK